MPKVRKLLSKFNEALVDIPQPPLAQIGTGLKRVSTGIERIGEAEAKRVKEKRSLIPPSVRKPIFEHSFPYEEPERKEKNIFKM